MMRAYFLTCLLLATPFIGLAPEAFAAPADDAAVADAAAVQEATSDSRVPDAVHGEQIFQTICSHCHHADHSTSAVGAPGLMDVLDRHDEAWINEWLRGPEAFARKDETAQALVASNPFGLIMPTLPEMQDEKNRLDIIAFLKTLKSE
ncbi:MAG: c-type cytochrome [Mariprofundaceae bacterium]